MGWGRGKREKRLGRVRERGEGRSGEGRQADGVLVTSCLSTDQEEAGLCLPTDSECLM